MSDRLGLLVGHARTVARAEGDGAARASHAELDSIQPRRGNTDDDVERVVAVLPGIVEKLRSLTRSPVGSRARR